VPRSRFSAVGTVGLHPRRGPFTLPVMLRALSIRQPWAWAVAAGLKRVENRSGRVSYRGPLAIHAGRVVETQAFDRCAQLAGQPVPSHLATGAVIAVAHLADIVMRSDDPWFEGPWGWLLDDVVPIQPVICPGQQQLFTLPDDVEQAVLHAIRPRAEA
jgi:hypothetical protein